MKQNLKLFATLAASTAMMFSCQQAEEPTMDKTQEPVVKTRAYGDKTPKVAIYVETNDVNPLNAGDYLLSDGTTYADIVEFFAANLNKETVNGVVRPTLYLNDKMTNLLENGGAATYVAGLQAKGIKVVLTILPNWQNIDFTSLNDTQADQLATILAYAVNKYGLDGIGFDNEYGGTVTTVSGSFGNLISKLRDKLPAGKLITLFQYNTGGSSQINATAGAKLDYVYSNFGYNTYISTSGVTKERYAPLSINLGSIGSNVSYYGDRAYDLTEAGYGAIMHFNLRTRNESDPLPLFNAIADGAWGETVTCENGNRPQDWTFVSSGYTITYDEATAE
ncbi:glycosyl hydrolase family 18 [Alistipes putredinis]|uniref:glycosyl hydrolase family 18 n=1 Tax=Alistipes putredinis TaxID=28117 RepID=UPI003AB3AEDD